MAKNLQLIFTAQDGKEIQLSIPNPVSGLTLATIEKAATDIIPALVSSSNSPAQDLKSARYETTTVEEITA